MAESDEIKQLINKRQKVSEAFSRGAKKSGLAKSSEPMQERASESAPGWKQRLGTVLWSTPKKKVE